MENCHVFYGHWLTTYLNPNHPSMAHLVACDYPKCSYKLGFHVIQKIIHGNERKIMA